MKKLIVFAVFISTFTFGQSVTIEPSDANKIISIKKNNIGIDHRSNNSSTGIGTFVSSTSAYIQTHTNHPLGFATNNGAIQMILQTNGDVGIGTTNPIEKLHVQGNAYFSSDFNSAGLTFAPLLNIGGGGTISKYLEFYLTGQPILAINANSCNTHQYSAIGFKLADAVTINLEGVSSNNLVVSNVRAYNDLLEVKYCNLGNTSTAAQTVNMRLSIIR